LRRPRKSCLSAPITATAMAILPSGPPCLLRRMNQQIGRNGRQTPATQWHERTRRRARDRAGMILLHLPPPQLERCRSVPGPGSRRTHPPDPGTPFRGPYGTDTARPGRAPLLKMSQLADVSNTLAGSNIDFELAPRIKSSCALTVPEVGMILLHLPAAAISRTPR
jgi:hypothetical protein